MKRILMTASLLAGFGLCVFGGSVLAQDSDTTSSFGGQGGANLDIEAIEPTSEAVRVGTAGEDPADIARYLLASGARGASLSPDGQTIAFSWSITGEPQLWVMPALGGQPKRLTFGSGVTFYRWLPGRSGLLYGADNDGDEQPAFFRISLDGTEESVVLPAAEGGFRVFGDFADGGDFVFSSTERNGLDFDIWRADLSGETSLVYEGTFGYFARSVSPDARYALVAETVGEDSDNLYLLDLETAALSTVSSPDPRANHSGAGFEWAHDGSGFYYATNRGREFAALEFYDLESGESRVVVEAEADIASLELCGADGGYLAWTVNRDGFYKLNIRDLSTGEAVAAPDLPEGVYGLSCGADTDRMAIGVNGWATPGEVYTLDLATGTTTKVFDANLAGLDPDRLIRPESIRITARDGVELQGLLYIPDESSRAGDGPAPVVFDVHGGPTAQSMATWNPSMQYLLDRGIAVFQPNVRGSTGFGRAYVTLDDQERRLDSVRDLVDMLEYFEDDPRIDASRAAVRGGSYGGYMVNAVLAAYPGAFDAGVSLFGVADWVTALEVASPGLKASDRIEYGDITQQRWRDFYTENSPIRQADRIAVPVLYSHGVMDPRIDIYETEVMVETLRENGVRADFIRIPDEGHGWRKLENQLFYYRREAEFLEEMLVEGGEG
ncbi:prolyl oligopeptidase family serine peptidase [Maricaulaceae bacterium MS644]